MFYLLSHSSLSILVFYNFTHLLFSLVIFSFLKKKKKKLDIHIIFSLSFLICFLPFIKEKKDKFLISFDT